MKTIINKAIGLLLEPQFIKSALLFITIVLLMTNQLHAQTITDPGEGNGGGDGDPDNVPIDGGISLLVAAGVGYGAKKMKERKAKVN